MLGTTDGHDAAPGRSSERGRVIRDDALRILQAGFGQPCALTRRARHVAACGDRHTDIEQQWVLLPRSTHGQRVGGKYRREAAKGTHRVLRGRRAGQDPEITGLNHPGQIGCQAGNVLAATQRGGDHAVLRNPGQRGINRLADDPGAGQKGGVPVEQRALVHQHHRLAITAACALHQPAHIVRHALHTVRSKAHQVGLQQHLGHHRGTFSGQARGLEQALAESVEVGMSVTHRHVRLLLREVWQANLPLAGKRPRGNYCRFHSLTLCN